MSQPALSITSRKAESPSSGNGKPNPPMERSESESGSVVPIGLLYPAKRAKSCEPLFWLLLGSALTSRTVLEKVLTLDATLLPEDAGRMLAALMTGREQLVKELERYGVTVTGTAWEGIMERVTDLMAAEKVRRFKARVQAAAAIKTPEQFLEWLQREVER